MTEGLTENDWQGIVMSEAQEMFDYGKISWLWSNSELHKEWPVRVMSQFILPPISLNQYCIIEHNNMPVAYCSWAFLDQKTEEKYILDPGGIRPESWKCGDRLWFCDWISPFSPKYTWLLHRAMKKRFPDKVARAIRVKHRQKDAKVAVFSGEKLTKAESGALRHQYFTDISQALSKHPDLGKDFSLVEDK